MSTRFVSVRQKRVFFLSLIYVVVFATSRLCARESHSFGHGVFDIIQAALPIIAGAWGLKFARQELRSGRYDHTTTGWVLIAVGCLMWGFGDVLSSYYYQDLFVEPPYPGMPDAFYLSAYLFVCFGIAVVLKHMRGAGAPRDLLDSVVTAVGVAIASWYFVIHRLMIQPSESIVSKAVSVSYSLLDLAIITGAVLLMSAFVADREKKSRINLACHGLIFLAVADTGFLNYSLGGVYHAGVWTDFCWLLGWLGLGLSFALQAWFPLQQTRDQESARDAARAATDERRRALIRMLLPYVVAAWICGVLVINAGLGEQHSAAPWAMYIVIALILMRQVVMLFDNKRLGQELEIRLVENRRLTGRIRSFSEGLEQVVELRAQQLGALHQLTKAVHTTQQVDGVLAAAAKHTIVAMRGITVAVWLRDTGAGPSAPPYCLSCFEVASESPVIERFAQCYVPRSCDVAYIVEITGSGNAEPAGAMSAGTSATLGEMLCAPLRFRNEILGIMAVSRLLTAPAGAEQALAFDQSDHDLIESIGIEVATALYHARQFAAAVDAADHDPVTNLYNHRAIHQRLDEELNLAKAEMLPLSVLMMDLNDFKLFNDTYGHPVGDQVLRLVAKALREENPDAICGRYGGDEFLVLAPRTTALQAQEFAERLRQRLITEGFQSPIAEIGQTIPIAISFGVAMFPEDSTNHQDLLALADANLYKAKKSDSGISVTSSSQRASRRLKTESSFGILDAMVTSIDNKDKYTRQHSEDVTKYALWLAHELRLSDETMRVIRIGALLHDVGKIGIPEEILRKPGHLSPEEYDVIMQHPNLGSLIVGAVPGMESIVDAVRYHHEKWDGSGYPDRLAGTDIPMMGRIMAVADAFSAMTTNRAYRAGMDWKDALTEIRKNIGTQFDPLMARAFCNAVRWRLSIDIPKEPTDTSYEESELPLAA